MRFIWCAAIFTTEEILMYSRRTTRKQKVKKCEMQNVRTRNARCQEAEQHITSMLTSVCIHAEINARLFDSRVRLGWIVTRKQISHLVRNNLSSLKRLCVYRCESINRKFICSPMRWCCDRKKMKQIVNNVAVLILWLLLGLLCVSYDLLTKWDLKLQ